MIHLIDVCQNTMNKIENNIFKKILIKNLMKYKKR